MLFEFYKYIEPLWYYNRPCEYNIPYWIDYRKLSADKKELVDLCEDYKDEKSRLADAALQLFKVGYITQNGEFAIAQNETVVNVHDNYIFVGRFFGRHWLLYIMIIRLISFKNPFREVGGFIKAWNVYPFYHELNNLNASFFEFDSELVKEAPLVTIVVPTLNRYSYLNNVLNDLEKQHYKNFEVIVCDQSELIDKDFYVGRNLPLTVIEQKEKALWLARNESIKAAKGNFIALSDDDMRISPDWLIQHLKCIDFFKVDISAGTFNPETVDSENIMGSFSWASHFSTNNVLLKKEVFRTVGLFDRRFEKQRMGDGEFGMRCYLNGIRSVSNPVAASVDVKAPVGGLRQMGSWDSIRPTKIFAPRPVPSVLYYARRYFGNNTAWLLLLKVFPKMIIPYRYRNNQKIYPLALLMGLFIFPVIVIQMVISWKTSSKMLKNGPSIEQFQ
jgi:glycosyltransferase involved in cell wall biosynthesis